MFVEINYFCAQFMKRQRKNTFYWIGLSITYLAFGLSLLVNSHLLALPTSSNGKSISEKTEKEVKNTPISAQGTQENDTTLQSASLLEAVVNASVLPLGSQEFDWIAFEFPLFQTLPAYPPIIPITLPYWQNVFGHIIVINGP